MTEAHTLMGSALLLGGVTAAWGRLKALASRLLSTVIVTATIRGDAAVAIQARCWKEFRRSRFGGQFYVSTRAFVRPVGRMQIVAYESLGEEPCVFWFGCRPLVVTALSSGENGANQAAIEVSFLRGTYDIERLLKESVGQLNESRRVGQGVGRRFFVKRIYGSRTRRAGGGKAGAGNSSAGATNVYAFDAGEARPVGWKPAELGSPLPESRNALHDLALSVEAMDVVHEVRYWLKNEERCRAQRRPWTRGILLYGKPGNGKTSLARAIAHDLDLPVFIFDLASLTNQELQDAWEAMQQHTPCIALIEDLHLVMERLRDNTGDCGFTLDALLNCMSGFEACDGVLKIGTANRLDGIDDALGIPSELSDKTVSTRPGRFDRAIEIPSPDEHGRRKLLKVMFPDADPEAEALIAKGSDDTAAQFVERCESLARRRDCIQCRESLPRVPHLATEPRGATRRKTERRCLAGTVQ